ncbi:MAG: nitroreductase family deazaflavin-dependent oxidoreductase [Chloroflexota bacterium]
MIIFKFFLSIHVFLYRLTGGRLGGRMSWMNNMALLLLTTTGRKTGKKRTTPLGYFEDDGAYVIIASAGGSDKHPAWYYNLKSNPQVAIQVGNRRMTAVAETADPETRQRLWAKLLVIAPGYGNYEKQTTREIPVVILKPE